jgi:hypothetical protein
LTKAKIDAQFFPVGRVNFNFLRSLGYGEHAEVFLVIRRLHSKRRVGSWRRGATGTLTARGAVDSYLQGFASDLISSIQQVFPT